MPERIALGSARREPRARGFGLFHEASDPFTVQLIDPDDPHTVIATLDNTFSRSFQDVPSGVGSGTVSIMNDDPLQPLVNEELALRFLVHDRPASQMLIESLTRNTRNIGEEAEQFTTIDGRSIVSILEEAVVYPTRGPATLPTEDTRIFNFANGYYNDAGWGFASIMGYQGSNALPHYEGLPSRWPTPEAAWIWAPEVTTDFAPAGVCYFRVWFVVPEGVSEVSINMGADDGGELWFDGQKVIETGGVTEYRSIVLPVTPGYHLIAVKAVNDARWTTLLGGGGSSEAQYTVVSGDTLWGIAARRYGDPLRWRDIYAANKAYIDAQAISHGKDPTYPGPGWWIFPGMTLTLPGIPAPGAAPYYFNPAAIIVSVHAYDTNGLGALLATSNASWRCLPYPENEPGMTPGEVVGILINEAKARGCFQALQTTFGAYVDTDGRPWRQVGDISVRVGDDYLTVMNQLAETYVDFQMSPSGLVLNCYDIDTPQTPSVTSYTEEYDITELVNKRSA